MKKSDADLNRSAAIFTILGFPVNLVSSIATVGSLMVVLIPVLLSGRAPEQGGTRPREANSIVQSDEHYQRGIKFLQANNFAAAKTELRIAMANAPSSGAALYQYTLTCAKALHASEADGSRSDLGTARDLLSALESFCDTCKDMPEYSQQVVHARKSIPGIRRLIQMEEQRNG